MENSILSPQENKKELRYFKRPGVEDIFEKLYNTDPERDRYYNKSFIGNPGSGTSNLVWAVALCLASEKQKKVLWMGRRFDGHDWAIFLLEKEGAQLQAWQISTSGCVFPPPQAFFRDPMLSEHVEVLIIDAFLESEKGGPPTIEMMAFNWAKEKSHRRVIHVSSLMGHVLLDDRAADELELEVIRAPVWTRDDFLAAVEDDQLKKKVFDTIKNRFPGRSHGDCTPEEIVDSKLFYSGINARWFFNDTIDKIKKNCMDVVSRLSDHQGGNSYRSTASSAFLIINLPSDREIMIITSPYLALVMTNRESYQLKFCEIFPLMERYLHGGSGETFQADFHVHMVHCHAVAEAETFFMHNKARTVQVVIGKDLESKECIKIPAGVIRKLPQNPSNDHTSAQPIGFEPGQLQQYDGRAVWFVPENKSQPFLDFLVITRAPVSSSSVAADGTTFSSMPENAGQLTRQVASGTEWKLWVIQNTISKKHEKTSDEDELKRVITGFDFGGIVLQSKVTVLYVVESEDQRVGHSLQGINIAAATSRERGCTKSFAVEVRRVLYPRTCSTEPSALSAGTPY